MAEKSETETVVLETEDVEESTEMFEGVRTFPWKEVSYVLIGPEGATLVSPEQAKTLQVPMNHNVPKPGEDSDSVAFTSLVGFVNEVSELHKTLTEKEEKLKVYETEIASLKEQLTEQDTTTETVTEDVDVNAKSDEVATEKEEAKTETTDVVDETNTEVDHNAGTKVLTTLLRKAIKEQRI